MKILVTGGAGFIGSHVVDAYQKLGHSIAIIDDLSTGRERNINAHSKFYRVDIRNSGEVEEILKRERFDLINHHAAQMDVRRSVTDPAYDASVNIIGALNLLESAVKTGVSKIIFASSGGAIYGEQDYFPADELHPTRPISPYGVAKLTTENYLFYYKAVYGLDSVCLRYANIYGPRQNPEGEAGVVAVFTNKMLRGQQPVINGEGTQTRDYVYVGDVVQANVLALNAKGSDVFNVGTRIETDVNQLFSLLKKHVGVSIEERHGEQKKGEQLRSALNYAKIANALGWKPSVSINDGLKTTVEYFKKEHGHVA